MKKCAFCDAEVEDDSLQCHLCGKSLFQTPRTRKTSPQKVVKRQDKQAAISLFQHVGQRIDQITQRMIPRAIAPLIGVLCLLFAIVVLWIFWSVTILTCVRVEPTQINCAIQKSLLGLIPLGEEQSLPHVQSADYKTDDGSNPFLQIHTTEGSVEIDFSNHPNTQEAARRINHFIQNSTEKVLRIRGAQPWIGLVCGSFLFINCLFLAYLSLRVALPGKINRF